MMNKLKSENKYLKSLIAQTIEVYRIKGTIPILEQNIQNVKDCIAYSEELESIYNNINEKEEDKKNIMEYISKLIIQKSNRKTPRRNKYIEIWQRLEDLELHRVSIDSDISRWKIAKMEVSRNIIWESDHKRLCERIEGSMKEKEAIKIKILNLKAAERNLDYRYGGPKRFAKINKKIDHLTIKREILDEEIYELYNLATDIENCIWYISDCAQTIPEMETELQNADDYIDKFNIEIKRLIKQ